MASSTEEISLRICDLFTGELSTYFKAIHARAVNATLNTKQLELQHTQKLLDIRAHVKADAADVLANCTGPGTTGDTLERELAALKRAYELASPEKAKNMSFQMQDILGRWMLEAARELYLRVEIFHKSNRKNLNPNLRAILVTSFFNVFSTAFGDPPTADSDDANMQASTEDEPDPANDEAQEEEEDSGGHHLPAGVEAPNSEVPNSETDSTEGDDETVSDLEVNSQSCDTSDAECGNTGLE